MFGRLHLRDCVGITTFESEETIKIKFKPIMLLVSKHKARRKK